MLNELAIEFAKLNMDIIAGIKKRGFTPNDNNTLAVVRENLLALKVFDLGEEEAKAGE